MGGVVGKDTVEMGKRQENVESDVIRFQLKCIEWKRHCDCCMLCDKYIYLL